MPWRGHDALHCTICERHRDEVGPLSARYKCASCARRRQQENLDQLQAHKGPRYRAWRRALITSSIDWLIEIGDITEEEGQRLLEFHRRSASRRLPEVATARQRRVGAELSRHYRKAPGNLPHSLFFMVMNIYMQIGTPRLEAEEKVVEFLRETYPDFTPLRA